MAIREQISVLTNSKDNSQEIESMTTVADVILEQLAAWGVQHMYGVPGDAIIPFLHALNKQANIQFFAVRHEFAAGIMASTEGKCTNRLGVCLGTSGPGLANMLNGLADAAADHIPLLVITGQVETKKIGLESKQYINQQQLIAPLAVFSETVTHPEAAADLLARAKIAALSKRGVAHLSVPKDIFGEVCTAQVRRPVGVMAKERKEELRQLDQAVMLLSAAQKPMLLLGEGARGATAEIIQLAELLQAGVVESLGAKGIVPYTQENYISGIGEGGTQEASGLLQQADCVLLIGVNWWPEGFVPQHTHLIKVDISSSNIEAQAGITCGLVGDAAEVLRLLMQRIRDMQEVHPIDRKAWQTERERLKAELERIIEQERSLAMSPLAPQRIIAVLEQVVAKDALLVVDTGDHTLWFNRIFRATRQQVLYSGQWRTMGFALPGALAAKVAYPNKQVVALTGDGCLSMSMMEMLTATKYELPIIVIVFNNKSLAMEKHKMMVEGYTPYGVDLLNPNFAELARSCGVVGFEVRQEQELLPTLQQAFTLNKPVLIDVHTAELIPPLIGFEQTE